MKFSEVITFKKDREKAFQNFFYAQDLIICRAALLLVITIMMVLGVIDYFRLNDISWVLLARIIVCVLLSILLFITFHRKISAAQLQLWLMVINGSMVASFFFMDAMTTMPPFYLPNSIVVYLFISSTVSGTRFRYSSMLNALVVVIFMFYFQHSISAEFHKSQIPNIVIAFCVSILISYMWEWYKRVNFLQQMQLNSLINIFSHDMVSPLNSLMGLISLHDSKLLNQEEYNTHIQLVKKSTANNILLIQNLVKWSKSQLDGFKPKFEAIKLADVITEATALFQHTADEKNIQFDIQVDDATCYADLEMMKLIIRNTVSNALKFSHSNSSITIKAGKENDSITLSIHDNGVGMEQEEIDKLFLMTVESQPGTENERGTGIGLYITRAFVVLNHGDISIQSSKGKGCTVTISLPENANTQPLTKNTL
jgi:signal transduction histidine kinase